MNLPASRTRLFRAFLTISIFEPGYAKSIFGAGQAILDELTVVSGGRAFSPPYRKHQKKLMWVVDRVALELRHQYVIGFTPTNAAQGGKWNKVKIKVTPLSRELKNLYVRNREGYFSPLPSPPAP